MITAALSPARYPDAGNGLECAVIHELKTTRTKVTLPEDRHAFFERAITALMDRMYGTAMRFTRNATDAEDLIAESLEKAWHNLDSLEDVEKFDGWMMRILSNTYISQWRKKQTRDKYFDDEPAGDDLDDTDSLYAKLHQPFLLWYGAPEKMFLDKLLREDIEKALDGLPEHYRMVVIMVQMMGYSYEEASDELDVPVGTVRSRLNRARKQLQDALWQNARDENLGGQEQE